MNAASNQSIRKRRRAVVLIVDDDVVVTQSLGAFLELETDYRIIEFQSPQEALQLVRQKPVDVVIADFNLGHFTIILNILRRQPY